MSVPPNITPIMLGKAWCLDHHTIQTKSATHSHNYYSELVKHFQYSIMW